MAFVTQPDAFPYIQYSASNSNYTTLEARPDIVPKIMTYLQDANLIGQMQSLGNFGFLRRSGIIQGSMVKYNNMSPWGKQFDSNITHTIPLWNTNDMNYSIPYAKPTISPLILNANTLVGGGAGTPVTAVFNLAISGQLPNLFNTYETIVAGVAYQVTITDISTPSGQTVSTELTPNDNTVTLPIITTSSQFVCVGQTMPDISRPNKMIDERVDTSWVSRLSGFNFFYRWDGSTTLQKKYFTIDLTNGYQGNPVAAAMGLTEAKMYQFWWYESFIKQYMSFLMNECEAGLMFLKQGVGANIVANYSAPAGTPSQGELGSDGLVPIIIDGGLLPTYTVGSLGLPFFQAINTSLVTQGLINVRNYTMGMGIQLYNEFGTWIQSNAIVVDTIAANEMYNNFQLDGEAGDVAKSRAALFGYDAIQLVGSMGFFRQELGMFTDNSREEVAGAGARYKAAGLMVPTTYTGTVSVVGQSTPYECPAIALATYADKDPQIGGYYGTGGATGMGGGAPYMKYTILGSNEKMADFGLVGDWRGTEFDNTLRISGTMKIGVVATCPQTLGLMTPA